MAMEKLYDVVSLSECMGDPATVAWLAQADVTLPGTIPLGRYPSPEEIRTLMDAIPGIRVDYLICDSAWEMTVRSRQDVAWAILAVRDYCGLAEEPHHFYFRAGWDEMIELVTVQLAKRCGPFVLLPDSGAVPKIVM